MMGTRRLTDRGSDRGASIVMFTILAPAFLFMVLVLVQVMIAGHVRHVLSNAAATGVAEVAAFDGSAAAGHDHADLLLADASGWVLSPTVSTSRTGDTANVTITAQAFKILPIGDWVITVERTAPVEVVKE